MIVQTKFSLRSILYKELYSLRGASRKVYIYDRLLLVAVAFAISPQMPGTARGTFIIENVSSLLNGEAVRSSTLAGGAPNKKEVARSSGGSFGSRIHDSSVHF